MSELETSVDESDIWKFFRQIDDFAECVTCKQLLSINKDDFNNLELHLKQHESTPESPYKREPQVRTKKNPKIWANFTRVCSEYADCIHCHKRYCYRTTSNNLAKHLLIQHLIDVTPAHKRRNGTESNGQPRIQKPKQRKRRRRRNYSLTSVTSMEVFDEAPLNLPEEQESERIVTNVSEFFDLEDDGTAKCMVCDEETENSIEDFENHITMHHPELLPNKEPNSEIILVKEEPKSTRQRLDSFSVSDTHFDTTEVSQGSQQEGQDDELTHFSRYLTSLMRTLPKEVQTKLQMDLLKTVMEAKMAADARDGKRSLNPLAK